MLKKVTSILMVCAQLCLVLQARPSWADETGSPEGSLVRTVLLLKSLDLSTKDLQKQMEAALKRYDSQAPAEGRTERLEAALVDLGILTPQQARSYTSGTRAADAALAAQQLPTPEAQGRALREQLDLFARINPVGAQFSSCTAGYISVVGGIIAVMVGVGVASNNPTCHDDKANGYDCAQEDCDTCYDHDGSSYECRCHAYMTTCYPTICDIPDYYPHRTAGTITAVAGGAAVAVGILLIVKGDGC